MLGLGIIEDSGSDDIVFPHSSHMGGVWERMIGITRRILNGILLQQNKKALTHEVLSTLMAEVSAVINSRPITTISSDPESSIIPSCGKLNFQTDPVLSRCCFTLVSSTLIDFIPI
jgi:hypothetical protein